MLKQWLMDTREYISTLVDTPLWTNPSYICRDNTKIVIKANPLEKNLRQPFSNLSNFYYLEANVTYSGIFKAILEPYSSSYYETSIGEEYLNVPLEIIEVVINLHGG